ncbi:hypothetical protein F5888DRAFT_1636191 [Russula emetica]|nr:hypothetical protein F5888DRAFT_1636191 [Russula emetica]
MASYHSVVPLMADYYSHLPTSLDHDRPKPLLLGVHFRVGRRDIDDQQLPTTPSLSSGRSLIACAPFLSMVSMITSQVHSPTSAQHFRLKEFTMRTESPRHFVLLAMHLAIPDPARMRLAVRTLAAPGCGLLTPWLQALPLLYASYTRGGLRNVRISGGPTRGRFLAWTDEPHDDTASFCSASSWSGICTRMRPISGSAQSPRGGRLRAYRRSYGILAPVLCAIAQCRNYIPELQK